MRRAVFSLLLMSLVAASPATQPADTQIQALINQLGDLRSSVREKATSELIAKGVSARAALVEASRSDDPEIASRASMILRNLPWDLPTDPPAIRDLLRKYNGLSPEQRTNAVRDLSNMPNNLGWQALMRLLREETDQSTRWQIVWHIRTSWSQPPEPEKVDMVAARRKSAQAIDTTADDAPLLTLAAAAWVEEKKDLATQLYYRAVLAAEFPTNAAFDVGEIDTAYRAAIGLLDQQQMYDDIARLMRHKAQSAPGDLNSIAGVPEGVCELFTLHAKVGPLSGFGDDCLRFGRFLLRPPVLYTLSYQLLRKQHTLLSQSIDRVACVSGGTDPALHLQVGQFLQRNGWPRPAIREYRTFLALQKENESLEDKLKIANTQLALGILYGQASDRLNAAKAIEAGLATLEPLPVAIMRTRDGRSFSGEDAKRDLKAEMNGHYLQDALAREDQAEVAKRIKLLVDLNPEDSEIVQEMVAYFTKTGDLATADKLFAGPEQKLRERLKKDDSPMQQNSLAWYLARCGRKLDEALALAQQAVAADPKNVALIDTLAEVHFQMGHQAEAIELESKALKMEPGRPELELQLRRFKQGKK